MTTPVLPTIHSNGTSANDLLDQVCEASNALREAIRRMEDAAPNGRDYYLQGNTAFRDAQVAHTARVAAVMSVVREYEAIAEGIAEFLE